MACSYDNIIAALHEERQLVKDVVYERTNTSNRLVLRKIRSGGTVARNENNDSVIYGQSRQASIRYRNLDHDPRDLVAGGEFAGRRLTGQNGIFTSAQNDIDDNQCHGRMKLDFSQGFRRRGTVDFSLDLETPTKCARDLERMDAPQIEGYFQGFRDQFTTYGFDNFDDNLLNLVIENGEANASVLGADEFFVTKGGWHAPPQNRITIHFLDEYREYLITEMRTKNMMVDEGWMLEIELPMNDWLDAVKEDLIQVHGMRDETGLSLTRFHGEMNVDPESSMRGRKFADYGNIRCYFNDTPIRGYFQPGGPDGDGNPTFDFVRIYPWQNEIGEEGGLVLVPNHDYRMDTIVVDAVPYDVVTLAPHIHEKSFMHYALKKPMKPVGHENDGVNYDVKVIDGAFIPNNEHDDMFKLVARHEFRFKAMYPELSGCIAYLHGRRKGYVLPVFRQNRDRSDAQPSGPEQYRQYTLDSDQTREQCAACEDGDVPNDQGQCVELANLGNSAFRFEPAGQVSTIFDADDITADRTVRIGVRREGNLAQLAQATVAVVAGGTTAVDGTHYQLADPAGVLNWEVGDDSIRYFDVLIIGGSGDPNADLTLELSLTGDTNADVPVGKGSVVIAITDLS